MLAVARALMSRPHLLMMDEPSLGLAPLLVKEIFNIIREINQNGTTILLIEQNAKAALQIAHYAYVLETGSVVLEGREKNFWKMKKYVKPISGRNKKHGDKKRKNIEIKESRKYIIPLTKRN